MFNFDKDTCAITLHAGDTGSKWIHATRKGGDDWTDDDRCLFTVKDGSGAIVMQRIYRLDDQWGLGDGVVLIEFHNDDTDDWEAGTYNTEVRFDFPPIWQGTPSSARCVNALTSSARMIEGGNVKTKIQATLEIKAVQGRI